MSEHQFEAITSHTTDLLFWLQVSSTPAPPPPSRHHLTENLTAGAQADRADHHQERAAQPGGARHSGEPGGERQVDSLRPVLECSLQG